MSTINDNVPPVQPVVVSFTWSPVSPLAFSVGGLAYPPSAPAGFPNVYTANATSTGTQITFVGAVTVPNSLVLAVQWFWNLGDGTTGYGQTVAHTYLVAFPNAQATLTVIDSNGMSWSCAQTLNLFNGVPASGNAYRIRRSS